MGKWWSRDRKVWAKAGAGGRDVHILEGIVSKRLGSAYRSGRSRDWIKSKNPAALAVKREADEDWGRRGRPCRP
jgi:ATP-dependent DNA ligase